MNQNEHLWIGEAIDISQKEVTVIELYQKDYNLIVNPFISIYENNDEIIFCAWRTFQDSIDNTRKAVALKMSFEEIEKEHPEHKFLIKPYLSTSIIGSIHDNTFTSGVQKFNVGLHSRFAVTSNKSISWFLSNSQLLNSLLLEIIKNPLLKPQVKSICKLLLQSSGSVEAKPLLLHSLSYLLQDDYFLLKDIADYIKIN